MGKPAEPNWEEWTGHWFLARVLSHLVGEFHDTILMGRYVMKNPLYKCMSWWFRCSRHETKEVLTLLAKAFPGIVFSNRGLRISTAYLDRDDWTVCDKEDHPKVEFDPRKKGGESSGVGA